MASSKVISRLLQQLPRHGLKVDLVSSQQLYQQCQLENPRSIRLLRLLPAASSRLHSSEDGSEAPLIAEMFSGSLYELRMQYDALSYVWGSEEKPKKIAILCCKDNETEASLFDCNITENLWRALCDLRNPDQPRVMWVDALCINQDDILEKNVQVAQMREVYIGAKMTLAHLGPPVDILGVLLAYRDCYKTRTGKVPRPRAPGGRFMQFSWDHGILRVNQTPVFIFANILGISISYLLLSYCIKFVTEKFLLRRITTTCLYLYVGLRFNDEFWQIKIFPDKEPEVLFSFREIHSALGQLFKLPWFSRAWIVQEGVVSPKVCFLIGRERFDIEDLSQMITDKVWRKEPDVDSAGRENRDLAFHQMVDMRLARSKGQPGPSLPTLLRWTWSYGLAGESSNPRDKIFALLGLVDYENHWHPDFSIDYSSEPHEVFWHYGKTLSQLAERSVVLEDPRRHDGSKFPSWVPDFSKKCLHGLHALGDFYSSSSAMPLTPYDLESDGASLRVYAILLAGIDFIGRTYTPRWTEFPKAPPDNITTPDQYDNPESLPEHIQYNNYLRSYLDLRDDIDDILSKNHQLRLFNGLNIDHSAEILAQVGLFSIPMSGSYTAPTSTAEYQAEKFLHTKDAKDLISKTFTSNRYYRLLCEGSVRWEASRVKALGDEIRRFFADMRLRLLDRRRLFQILQQKPEAYPLMSQHPLFQVLSSEEWPTESLRVDEKNIPRETFEDDQKLWRYFIRSLSWPAGLGTWAERRLAKTPEGYLCNVDNESELGDQIAVVSGCRMPLILRPKHNGTYRVVGHAYVMGLMYGEAMKLGIEPQRIVLS